MIAPAWLSADSVGHAIVLGNCDADAVAITHNHALARQCDSDAF